MCLSNFSDEFNQPLNILQLMVYKVLMFHDNSELLPYSESYELSMCNIDPADCITLALVGIPIRKQLCWVKVAKESSTRGTNTEGY